MHGRSLDLRTPGPSHPHPPARGRTLLQWRRREKVLKLPSPPPRLPPSSRLNAGASWRLPTHPVPGLLRTQSVFLRLSRSAADWSFRSFSSSFSFVSICTPKQEGGSASPAVASARGNILAREEGQEPLPGTAHAAKLVSSPSPKWLLGWLSQAEPKHQHTSDFCKECF